MNARAVRPILSSAIPLCVTCLLAGQVLLLSLGLDNLHAQAPPITPSGLNTQVNLSPTPPPGKVQYDITGGTRAGTNLFHSFGDFGVPNNNIANFLNEAALPTNNILGRVTGGNVSNIFGTIQTNGPGGFGNANFFLMNPAGVIFGPTATLNVGGMAAFTTADYLRLAEIDGVTGIFHANPAATSVLTASPVAAFGFLGSNPGAITVQGSRLTVASGTGLALIGGNITIESGIADGGIAQPAQLSSPNGKIHLAGTASPGEFDAATLQALPNVDGASFTSFGSVFLASGSSIDITGTNTVLIRGGQFVLSVNEAALTTADTPGITNSIVLSHGSVVISSNTGTDLGADVGMTAGAVRLDGSSITSTTSGLGSGGNVSIDVASLDLTNGAQIVTKTDGPGLGGRLDVMASDHVALAGVDLTGTVPGVPSLLGSVPSGLLTVSSSTGAGGDVTVTAPRVDVLDGGHMATFGSGDGAGGELRLNVGSLNVQNSAQIWSSSGLDPLTFAGGGGSGGHITVNATDEIVVSGGDPAFGPSQISTNAFATGDGGRIDLITPTLRLEDSGTVSSLSSTSMNGPITIQADTLSISGFLDVFGSPLTGGIVATSSNPLGQGGGIAVTASSVNVAHGSILNTGGPITLSNVGTLNVTDGGQVTAIGAGALTITATDSVNVTGEFAGSRSRIENIAPGDAPNGGISITAGNNVSVTDGGRINLEIGSQPGGQIAIRADSITLARDGKIRMDVGEGGGGHVQLTARTVTLDQGSGIQTVTIGDSPAGAINIDTTSLTLTSASLITSETGEFSPNPLQIGAGGPIEITANDSVQLSGGSRITTSSLTGGDTGLITVQADNGISLIGAGTGLFSEARSTGNGRSVTVLTNSFVASDGAAVSASSTGSGAAGNINITAGNQFTMVNSSVTTEATQSSGGIIKITTNPSGTVELSSSTISASVLDGTGGGGSVNIDPQFVILQNSQILAQAVQGPGGNINITITNGGLFLPDATSVVSASSEFGQQGTVTIQAPIAPAGGKIQPLGKTPLQVTALLSQRCAAIARGEVSSFVMAGRDTLPTEPGGWLTSPLATAPREAGASVQAGLPGPSTFSDESAFISLRRLPSPNKVAQILSEEDWLAGCGSS